MKKVTMVIACLVLIATAGVRTKGSESTSPTGSATKTYSSTDASTTKVSDSNGGVKDRVETTASAEKIADKKARKRNSGGKKNKKKRTVSK